MKNENPNFDFYSFNNPGNDENKSGTASPAADNGIAPDDSAAPGLGEAADPTAIPVPPDELTPEQVGARQRSARRSLTRLGLGMVILLACWIGGQLITQIAIALADPSLLRNNVVLLLTSSLPLYLVGMPVFYLTVRGLPRAVPKKEKTSFLALVILFLIAVALMIAGNLAGNWIMRILGALSGRDFSNMLEQAFDTPLWFSILFTVILAPVLEELIFRKVLVDRLRPFGEEMAMVLSGLLFGAFHGNFYQFFYASAIGMLLAYVYMRSGKLRCNIGLHMLINFIGGILPTVLSDALGYDEFISLETPEEVTAYIMAHLTPYVLFIAYQFLLYGMALAGLVLLCVFARKMEFERQVCELPKGQSSQIFFSSWGMLLLLAAYIGLFALQMV